MEMETQVPGLHWSKDSSPAPRPRSARKAKASKHSTPKERGTRWGPGSPGRPGPIAALPTRRRLSSVRASVGSGGRSGPSEGPSAAGQPPEPRAGRSHNPGLPRSPGATGRKRQGPKGQATEMERVRQWEARLLQQIEEAVQHELTIEYEDCKAEIRDAKGPGAS